MKSRYHSYADEVKQVYDRTRDTTLTTWAEHEGFGTGILPTYHKTHLGVTTGERFDTHGWIAECHARVSQCTEQNPALDLVHKDWLHFTFLALSSHEYPNLGDLPAELEFVRDAYRRTVSPLNFTIKSVRLLPFRNALVLAGVPDEASFQARADFAAVLLKSPWEPYLIARYAGFTVPPTFWHTTLVRSETEYLPPELRDIYTHYASYQTDELNLGVPKLAATNYNWSTMIEL